jgi:hypothetical protein
MELLVFLLLTKNKADKSFSSILLDLLLEALSFFGSEIVTFRYSEDFDGLLVELTLKDSDDFLWILFLISSLVFELTLSMSSCFNSERRLSSLT